MKHRFISLLMTTAALLLGSDLALAADATAVAPQAAASKAKASTKIVKNQAAAKIKLVDINSASAAELKKLPGITDADAAKIIAGRPYASKAWLVSNKVLAEDKYPAIRQLIIAKQPNKDAAKNAALYSKKK